MCERERERERERESKESSLLYFYKVCACHGKNVTTGFVKKNTRCQQFRVTDLCTECWENCG